MLADVSLESQSRQLTLATKEKPFYYGLLWIAALFQPCALSKLGVVLRG